MGAKRGQNKQNRKLQGIEQAETSQKGKKNNQAGHLIFSSSPGCCCVNQFLIMKERV